MLMFIPYRVLKTHVSLPSDLWNLHILKCICESCWYKLKNLWGETWRVECQIWHSGCHKTDLWTTQADIATYHKPESSDPNAAPPQARHLVCRCKHPAICVTTHCCEVRSSNTLLLLGCSDKMVIFPYNALSPRPHKMPSRPHTLPAVTLWHCWLPSIQSFKRASLELRWPVGLSKYFLISGRRV